MSCNRALELQIKPPIFPTIQNTHSKFKHTFRPNPENRAALIPRRDAQNLPPRPRKIIGAAPARVRRYTAWRGGGGRKFRESARGLNYNSRRITTRDCFHASLPLPLFMGSRRRFSYIRTYVHVCVCVCARVRLHERVRTRLY